MPLHFRFPLLSKTTCGFFEGLSASAVLWSRAPAALFPMASVPPDPLDPLLDRWGQPPVFRPLAADLRARLTPAPVGETIFLRPAFAAVFIAACVLLGLFLAEVRVSRLHQDRDAQLLDSYRRLIDPLLTAVPPSPDAKSERHT